MSRPRCLCAADGELPALSPAIALFARVLPGRVVERGDERQRRAGRIEPEVPGRGRLRGRHVHGEGPGGGGYAALAKERKDPVATGHERGAAERPVGVARVDEATGGQGEEVERGVGVTLGWRSRLPDAAVPEPGVDGRRPCGVQSQGPDVQVRQAPVEGGPGGAGVGGLEDPTPARPGMERGGVRGMDDQSGDVEAREARVDGGPGAARIGGLEDPAPGSGVAAWQRR